MHDRRFLWENVCMCLKNKKYSSVLFWCELSMNVTLDGRQEGAKAKERWVGMALPDSKGFSRFIDIQSQAPHDVTLVQYCAEVPPTS